MLPTALVSKQLFHSKIIPTRQLTGLIEDYNQTLLQVFYHIPNNQIEASFELSIRFYYRYYKQFSNLGNGGVVGYSQCLEN